MKRIHFMRSTLMLLSTTLALYACGGKVSVGEITRGSGSNGPVDGVGGGAGLPAACFATTRKASTFTTDENRPVDVLFAVDNSQRMASKQTLLAQAASEFVQRLVTPNCVDENGAVLGQPIEEPNGTRCEAGSLEFPPVKDLHVGVITSSLGGVGAASTCVPTDKVGPNKSIDPDLNRHNDDAAHLVDRVGAEEGHVPDLSALGFLSHVNSSRQLAAGEVNAKNLPESLKTQIEGIHDYGCGYEAQLESIYRFLVQPDPYASVRVDSSAASLVGIDETILQQRAAFLRPNSYVAVILLTDEDESTPDPRSLGGQGWRYADSAKAARPTVACAADPNSAACNTCRIRSAFDSDPTCKDRSGGLALLSEEEDGSNVRFINPKQRFGYDARYSWTRYAQGFRSQTVPNRDEEHPLSEATVKEYAQCAGSCTNPLFAASLPTSASEELCDLPLGNRGADDILFTTINGVPWQLLSTEGATGDLSAVAKDSAPKTSLDGEDWTRLLGKDPNTFDTTGQNTFMHPSIQKRTGVADGNPVNGGEWDTASNDVQYACTFDLPAPRECPKNAEDQACACGAVGVDGPQHDFPLCRGSKSNDVGFFPTVTNTQVRDGAEPGLQALRVARSLGAQSLVSSICPRETADATSPLFGYRPTFRMLGDRVGNLMRR